FDILPILFHPASLKWMKLPPVNPFVNVLSNINPYSQSHNERSCPSKLDICWKWNYKSVRCNKNPHQLVLSFQGYLLTNFLFLIVDINISLLRIKAKLEEFEDCPWLF